MRLNGYRVNRYFLERGKVAQPQINQHQKGILKVLKQFKKEEDKEKLRLRIRLRKKRGKWLKYKGRPKRLFQQLKRELLSK